jgi:hypothetical protein
MVHTVLLCRFDSKHSPCALQEGFRRLRIACNPAVSSSSLPPLLEELVVTHVFDNLDKAMFLAEIINLCQKRVVASFKLFFEANPSSLYPNLNDSVCTKDLIETQLIPSIFSKDIPDLNNIYQFLVTLTFRARLSSKTIWHLQGNSW